MLGNAIKMQPACGQAYAYLGTAMQEMGKTDEAIVLYREAIRLKPDSAEAFNNFGNILYGLQRFEEALFCYQSALRINAEFAEAHNNLGNVLRKFHRFEEALGCYTRAVELRPEFGDAWNNLGSTLGTLGNSEGATRLIRLALEKNPDSVPALYNLANNLRDMGRREEAIHYFREALRREPTFAEAHNNLGNLYKDMNLPREAMKAYRQALRLKPGYVAAYSNMLFAMNYVEGLSQKEIYREHRRFNGRYGVPLAGSIAPHANVPDPERRLRIGYISADFRAHAVASFLEPIFRHHDRQNFQIHCYAEVQRPDAVTQRFVEIADVWRSTLDIPDAAVSGQIRADQIDVLIDLAGHTGGNRMLVLARKPAPIQITYLGYPATTGLDTVDYRLTDARTEPVGQSEKFYTEKLYRLPNSLWCFAPGNDYPDVGPLPALSNGYLTFGSMNNYAKIGPSVIALWARLLKAIPSARLLFVTVTPGETQQRLRSLFQSHGVDPDRLELHDKLDRGAFLKLHQRIDIALDPFPCNGGTTTCDAFWMGVPVLGLRGRTFLSRAGYSLMSTIGLEEHCCATEKDFIALATRLAVRIHLDGQ